MKKFDAVLYMLPVPNGEFENVVNPNTKAIIHRNPKYDHTPVYAIVLDIHPQENEDPLIDVAFLHPSQAGALAGADWREAFERVFAVRHVDHDDVGENFAMGHYRELPDQEEVRHFVDAQYKAFDVKVAECISLNRLVLELEAKLAEASKPTPGTFETKHYADGSSATGLAPLPDHSPAEQEALLPSAADLDAAAAEQQAKEQTAGQ